MSADPAVPVRTTAAGTVTTLRVRVGDMVEVDTPLLEVVTETPGPEVPAVLPADPAASVVPTVQPKPKRTTTVVRAASVGTLATLDVLVDQEVAVGDVVASVSPGTLTVSAPLTQEQQFRLLAPPALGDVSVPGGPAPFVCTDVRTALPPVGAPAAATAPVDPYSPVDPSAGATGAVATCRVPPGATVFVGMSATVSLQAGSATDVLVLPVTAVEGSVSSGTVYLPGPDGGDPLERSVELGLTDGEQVEVRSGLLAGDSVLEFVPTSDEPVDGESYAEDPLHDFRPTPGILDRFTLPGGPFTRVDTHAFLGWRISSHYDSLLAKIIVWAADRDAALSRMRRALAELDVQGTGIRTTADFLTEVLAHPDFVAGRYDTGIVDSVLDDPARVQR